MTTPIRFAQGDTVRHPKRPEWGIGTVRSIQAIAQPDGTRAQRLTVDFANQGRKNINTAIAPLVREGDAKPVAPAKPSSRRNTPQPPLPQPKAKTAAAVATAASSESSSDDSSGGSGWLDAMDPDGAKSNELWDLPDALSDPFASLPDRLAATLETYRFSTEARALMDWAIVQTGLNDPLSKYSRSELEQAFPRYVRDRDAHLKEIVKQLKRENNFAALKDAGRGLFPAAQSALDKAIRN
ncbi:MAG: DUF3553 domain-containing protein [Planctomycetota bacterium]